MKKIDALGFLFAIMLVSCGPLAPTPSSSPENKVTPISTFADELTQTITPTSSPFLEANKMKFLSINAITSIESTIHADQTDYWMVGDQGFIVHWMSASYPVYVDSPAGSENLYDVDFVSPNDGWMVGGGDMILHWNGEEWDISKPSTDGSGWPYSYSLYNIALSEENDGWAAGCVGSEGGQQVLIYHWDGTTWSQVSLPEELLFRVCIHDIAAISPNDVWMTGTSWYEGKEYGVALHWDGNIWESFSEDESFVIHSLSALSPDNMWAVTRYGIIWHWDGIEWVKKAQLDFTGLENAPVIFAREPDDIFVAGNKIWHWDGNIWLNISLNSNLPADMNIIDIVAGPMSEGGNPFIYMLDSSGMMYTFAEENFR